MEMKNKKRQILKRRGKGAVVILAMGLVMTSTYAFITDENLTNTGGQMANLGIETVMSGGISGQLEKGEEVVYNIKTDVKKGVDVKVRQRVKVDAKSLENIEEGNITLKVGGKVPSIQDLKTNKGYITPITTVRSNGSMNTEVSISVDSELVSGIPETDINVEVITEALQDRNTVNSDFEQVSKVEF